MQSELEYREQRSYELLDLLESINTSLAKLNDQKVLFELELIAVLQHNKEGSKSYAMGDRAVTVTTDKIYSLNKSLYSSGDLFIPAEFDPIVAKTEFSVNKALYKKYMETSPFAIRESLKKLIVEKDAKARVVIKLHCGGAFE